MTVTELYRALDAVIPPSLSCDWDNDGLLCCPDPDREAKKLLLVLDITDNAVDYAIEHRFDVIVSHHPLIFKPLKALITEAPVPRRLLRLVRHGIAAMSFHTRFDSLPGGVNDVLASVLGLTDIHPFGPEGEQMGRIGNVSPCSLPSFAAHVKAALGAPSVLVSGNREVRRVAVLGGSGSDFIEAARLAGADTYVSGELDYHPLTEATALGINLIEAGHFHTEAPSLTALADLIRTVSPKTEIELRVECDIFAV